MRLSVVTTLYKSRDFLREFHGRISSVAAQVSGDYEIIYVDDGSPDDSLLIAREIQKQDRHVKVIELSRNFGHHQAIWTGLTHSRGDLVFLIDSDLEEEPELLLSFHKELTENNDDVVYGVARERNGSFLKKWGGALFYKVFNTLADISIPRNLLTIRLMGRDYLDALLSHQETSFALSGLWARTGFRQRPLVVAKGTRNQPSYDFFKRMRMVVQTVAAFSSKPLVLGFYLGMAAFLMALLGAGKLIVDRIFYSTPPEGWTFLAVSIWGIGGVILFCQGVQGIYLAKIFQETKRRPVSIIRKIYQEKEAAGGDSKNAA